jgi:hypothetical protein
VAVNRLAGHTHDLGNLLDFVALPPHFLDSADLSWHDVRPTHFPPFGKGISRRGVEHWLKVLLDLPQKIRPDAWQRVARSVRWFGNHAGGGLDNGTSKAIWIKKAARYLTMAAKREG